MVDSKSNTEADELFGELGINVVSGQHFSGGFVGDQEDKDDLVRRKVNEWVCCVKKLTLQLAAEL